MGWSLRKSRWVTRLFIEPDLADAGPGADASIEDVGAPPRTLTGFDGRPKKQSKGAQVAAGNHHDSVSTPLQNIPGAWVGPDS